MEGREGHLITTISVFEHTSLYIEFKYTLLITGFDVLCTKQSMYATLRSGRSAKSESKMI